MITCEISAGVTELVFVVNKYIASSTLFQTGAEATLSATVYLLGKIISALSNFVSGYPRITTNIVHGSEVNVKNFTKEQV